MKKFKLKASNVKTTAKFNALYKELYSKHIIKLENLRKKICVRIVLLIISVILFLFFAHCVFNVDVESFGFEIVQVIFYTIIAICPFFGFSVYQDYIETYKNNVLAEFFKLINDKLIYTTNVGAKWHLMEKSYKNANFDLQQFNEFFVDDYIEGNLDNDVFIRMADMRVQKVSESFGEESRKRLFSGLFVETSCSKSIETDIKITRDKFKVVDRNDLVKLDNQIFEKYFDIYSANSNLVYRILTADVMNVLIDFYTKYELDFEIVFKGNNIYIRFFTGNMFEPKVFGNSLDRNLIVFYYTILNFILDLTKTVNHILDDIEM